MWPSIAARGRVRQALQAYGVEDYEREPERVRLAILRASEGKMERLLKLVRAAKQDYRDALMTAEYPGEARALCALRPELSEEERERLADIRAQDRKQYLEWLRQ